MTILVLGATGFIGRALVARLVRDGHHVIAWVRDLERARAALGADVELVAADGGEPVLGAAVARAGGVVNLAGEPILEQRWSDQRRAVLRASRVGVTEMLARAIAAASPRPDVLVQGSAIGIYGDRGDEELVEDAAAGAGFLAELCRDWEAAAQPAATAGARVVLLRTGIVLGRGGGALAKMVPVFRAGVGGAVGGGRQWQSWIHLDDHVGLVVVALGDPRWRGAVNATAPEPVTGRALAKALGHALHRPSFMPVPGFALKLLYGKAAQVMLESQRVLPRAALGFGYRFGFTTLPAALADILGRPPAAEASPPA